MANLVYIDETGSVGKGAKKQPLLTVAAVLIDEDHVQTLAKKVRNIATEHLGHVPLGFELHGHEMWGGSGVWSGLEPAGLISAYEAAIALIEELDIKTSWASIHKQRLHDRHGGAADNNAYVLALQFLLEKIDSGYPGNKILIADEQKEHQLRAIRMVADMQEWGGGEVPSSPLKTIIDSIHFVSSQASPGVQLADLVAFALQRKQNNRDTHRDAISAITRIHRAVCDRASTWREPWPRPS